MVYELRFFEKLLTQKLNLKSEHQQHHEHVLTVLHTRVHYVDRWNQLWIPVNIILIY